MGSFFKLKEKIRDALCENSELQNEHRRELAGWTLHIDLSRKYNQPEFLSARLK